MTENPANTFVLVEQRRAEGVSCDFGLMSKYSVPRSDYFDYNWFCLRFNIMIVLYFIFIFVQMCQPFSKNALLYNHVTIVPSYLANYFPVNLHWKALLDFLFALFPSSLFLRAPFPLTCCTFCTPGTSPYTYIQVHTHTYIPPLLSLCEHMAQVQSKHQLKG